MVGICSEGLRSTNESPSEREEPKGFGVNGSKVVCILYICFISYKVKLRTASLKQIFPLFLQISVLL